MPGIFWADLLGSRYCAAEPELVLSDFVADLTTVQQRGALAVMKTFPLLLCLLPEVQLELDLTFS